MIVITFTKVPNSLRGDLTKWCQEIQTGVYVGNTNSKIRDLLWERIIKNIGTGEATMAFNTNNELGYDFRTTRKDKEIIDLDGLPFMLHLNRNPEPIKHGFSKAARYHRAKLAQTVFKKKHLSRSFVALDLETTGLNIEKNVIISIGAAKRDKKYKLDTFYCLIKTRQRISEKIKGLTGITNQDLEEKGTSLIDALTELRNFVGTDLIIGYNIAFDDAFLRKAFKSVGLIALKNPVKDLLPIIKKKNLFLDNYHLSTVLAKYHIVNKRQHNSKFDAVATLELAEELIKKGVKLN